MLQRRVDECRRLGLEGKGMQPFCNRPVNDL